MQGGRLVPTPWLVGMSILAGAVAGLLAGRLWTHVIDLQEQRLFFRLSQQIQRRRDPARWIRDSVARERAFRAFPPVAPPQEIRREQMLSDCLVTFQLPDTTFANWVLFEVYARDARGALLGRAGAYNEGGFGPGDRMSVIVPDVRCASVAGFGLNMLPATSKPPPPWAEPCPGPRPPPCQNARRAAERRAPPTRGASA